MRIIRRTVATVLLMPFAITIVPFLVFELDSNRFTDWIDNVSDAIARWSR